jgi:hypothetical protein
MLSKLTGFSTNFAAQHGHLALEERTLLARIVFFSTAAKE